MMSLLCVCVKKAQLSGSPNTFNTYVCLKLQNVKSTTIAVKGNSPSWEQDFMFETQRLDSGLVLELWNKGMLWDKLLGTTWLPLLSIHHSNQEGNGSWLSLDSEILMRNGSIVGTQTPTGHLLLVDARFELPFDISDGEAHELQNKLDYLNNVMEQEMVQIAEQHRRQGGQQSLSQCMSEDSDYTSDYNLPMQHQHNQPVFQYRSEHNYGHFLDAGDRSDNSDSRRPSREGDFGSDSEPLFYNSRPPTLGSYYGGGTGSTGGVSRPLSRQQAEDHDDCGVYSNYTNQNGGYAVGDYGYDGGGVVGDAQRRVSPHYYFSSYESHESAESYIQQHHRLAQNNRNNSSSFEIETRTPTTAPAQSSFESRDLKSRCTSNAVMTRMTISIFYKIAIIHVYISLITC